MPSRAITPALQGPARRVYALRTHLFEKARPFSEWLGKTNATPVTWSRELCLELGRHLVPGMLLLGRRERLASNLFVPGYWKHAAIVGADSQGLPSTVVEATVRRGVGERSVAEFVRDFDEVAVVAPRIVERARWAEISRCARARAGRPYDFGFVARDNGQYYCSKLIYWALNDVLGRPSVPLRLHWGGIGLMPSDFLRVPEDFELVARLSADQVIPPSIPMLDEGRQSRAA